MNEPTDIDRDRETPAITTPTDNPPPRLGVYDRPERSKLSLPVIIALIVFIIIIGLIVWQLWL